jgi:tRNA (mo5U34)-methyltransferase
VKNPYRDLYPLAREGRQWCWLIPLLEEGARIVRSGNHGDLPHWLAALDRLPAGACAFDGDCAAPVLGEKVSDPQGLREALMAFHPWRKGPLKIGGITVDTEWRSDWKWARIEPHLELSGHTVLDIGCGNGYYGWRMLGAGAERVIGIDPTLVYVMQWLACHRYAGDLPNHVLPLGLEHLPASAGGFDSVFSMGVLYHRKDPVSHLERLASLVKPGGQVVLETLVLEGGGMHQLVPQGRYARMKNVWAVPALERLQSWMASAGLKSMQVLDVSPTSQDEQRSTDWMTFESLRECLDPGDHSKTVEGHPAPVRAAILAKT